MTRWSPWNKPPGWAAMPAEDFGRELARSHPHYEVERLLGHGGMGAVYAALDREVSRAVAIKMLRPDALADETYLRRFDEEIASLRRVQHDNTVRILDAGTTADGYRFFVMELLEGESLAQVLAGPARLRIERVVRIMRDVCAGVQHVHEQGLVHRDLKAANIFLAAADGRAVVLDFGVARAAVRPASTATRLHGTPGTHGHIAPEVRQGQSATAVSDVFSLGVVFLQMVNGEVPDVGHAWPSDFGLDPRLDVVAQKALSQDPKDRYRSAAELASAIEAAAAPGLSTAPPPLQAQAAQVPAQPAIVSSAEAAAPLRGATGSTDGAVWFCDAASAERHRAFFAAYGGETLAPSDPPKVARPGELWRAERHWDASVPRRGDVQPINPPVLVAWSPRGDCLFTSCDAWGLKVWGAEDGRLLGQDTHATSYGYPYRFFVSQRGACSYVLQETSSYQHTYYLLHDNNANLLGMGWNNSPLGRIGWMGLRAGPPARLDTTGGFDPWRPGSEAELVVLEDDRALKIVDIRSLDHAAETTLRGVSNTRITLINRLINFAVQRLAVGPSASAKQRSPLADAAALHVLRFDPLGARDGTIRFFHWHRSGEYLAVETGDSDHRALRGVYVVHLRSAQIVASVPGPAAALGWSPGGRFLMVKRWPAASDHRQAVVCLWDATTFTLRHDIDAVLDQPWARRCLHSAPPLPGSERSLLDSALSADGQRMLVGSDTRITSAAGQRATVKHGATIVAARREGVKILPGEVVAQVANRGFAHAAWSPTDPHCFATVGGEGSDDYPDTYKYWDVQHGRLLRVWRLVPDGPVGRSR